MASGRIIYEIFVKINCYLSNFFFLVTGFFLDKKNDCVHDAVDTFVFFESVGRDHFRVSSPVGRLEFGQHDSAGRAAVQKASHCDVTVVSLCLCGKK